MFSDSWDEQQRRSRAAGDRYLQNNPTCDDDCALKGMTGYYALEGRIFVDMILDEREATDQSSWLGSKEGLNATGLNDLTATAVLACVDRHKCGACVVRFGNR